MKPGENLMKVIDMHNHFYPPEYLEAIQTGQSNIKVTYDANNNPLLHYPGDYNIVVPGHRDIDYRAQVLEEAGVDMQVLTFTTPGVHIESPERSVELARMVNDNFAKIKKKKSQRFDALATLPLNDPEASVLELDRAFSELVFSGVVEKYPKIRWKLGHLGGTIPYLAERLDRGYAAFKEYRWAEYF